MSTYTKKQIGLAVSNAEAAARASDPGVLAASMEVLLANDNWMQYVDPADRREYRWQDFREFVERRLHTTPEALAGYLASFPVLRGEVDKAAKGHALKVAALVGAASTGQPGLPNRHGGRGRAQTRMRRLLTHRPDLAQRVESGEVSVTEATRLAGWEVEYLRVPPTIDEFALYAVRRFGREKIIKAVTEARPPTRPCRLCGKEFAPSRGESVRPQTVCMEPPCRKELQRERAARKNAKKAALKKAEKEAQG